MKQLLLSITLSSLLGLTFAQNRAKGLVTDHDIENFRVAGIVDLQGSDDGNPVAGVLIGIGQNIHPLDEMIFSYYHIYHNDIIQDALVISIEERYDIFRGLRPYAKAGVGYMWSDRDNESNQAGVFAEFGGGIIIPFGAGLRFFAEGSVQLGDSKLWIDNGELDDHNVQFTSGIRLYY